jgi:hypothetical protein
LAPPIAVSVLDLSVGPNAAGRRVADQMSAGKADVLAELVDDTVQAADQCTE